MNFLPARLLPGARADGDAVAGVRPESVTLGVPGAPDALAAIVEQLEPLGHETLVHVRITGGDGPVRWVVREPGMTRRSKGDAVAVHVAPGAVQLFAADGRALG
jgi:ABC-type sugar transport system ATPase subunit